LSNDANYAARVTAGEQSLSDIDHINEPVRRSHDGEKMSAVNVGMDANADDFGFLSLNREGMLAQNRPGQ
jgi:hypothetical protein